ncbi:MAG: uracil-DNA glycosylase [Gemmatimonadetes bacterium]|nr:uracil-DNA glycosylase [Gemmatimonadota bacterium]
MDESPGLLETLALARDFLAQEIAYAPASVALIDDRGSDADPLTILSQEACNCQKCGLAQTRTSVVFGSGRTDADLIFIGEAPGAEEDRQGLPFMGAAGQLLTRMIEAMGLTREDVYIANIIKCRPPNNRDPKPDEIAACQPYLLQQIEQIAPVVICTLGRFAAQTLLHTTESMGRLRGKIFEYQGAKLVPTYHPAALLRNAHWKRPAWEDLKLVRKLYDGTEI